MFHQGRGGGEPNDKKIGGMVPTIKLAPIESAATVTLPRYRVSSSQGSLHYNEKHLREEDHHPPPLGPKRGAGLEGSPTQGWTTRFSMIAFARPSALLSGVAGCASLFFFLSGASSGS